MDSKLDGVLGLQYVKDVSLPAQFTRKIGTRDIFGHCIAPKEPNGEMSGYLILGYHALTMSQKLTWVPIFVATPPSRYLKSSYLNLRRKCHFMTASGNHLKSVLILEDN